MADHTWFMVTLGKWLERQERQNVPHRVELGRAIHQGDVATVRELLRDAPFTPAQQRHLDDLLDRWEHATRANGEAAGHAREAE